MYICVCMCVCIYCATMNLLTVAINDRHHLVVLLDVHYGAVGNFASGWLTAVTVAADSGSHLLN